PIWLYFWEYSFPKIPKNTDSAVIQITAVIILYFPRMIFRFFLIFQRFSQTDQKPAFFRSGKSMDEKIQRILPKRGSLKICLVFNRDNVLKRLIRKDPHFPHGLCIQNNPVTIVFHVQVLSMEFQSQRTFEIH